MAAAEVAEIGEVKIKGEDKQTGEGHPEGVPDTPPHLLNRAVIATTSMGTRLGTAWPPIHVLGKTGVHRSNEDPASLAKKERKTKLIMTICSQV